MVKYPVILLQRRGNISCAVVLKVECGGSINTVPLSALEPYHIIYFEYKNPFTLKFLIINSGNTMRNTGYASIIHLFTPLIIHSSFPRPSINVMILLCYTL